jgi:NADH:ubiquinone oxidoreductase subunit 4 (subunit M)
MAATIFFTVGALTDTTADDHDLTLARIVVTPVRAGLAAVGGVLLTAMLSLTVLKSPALQASNQQLGLGTIYNLNSNTFGIIIAAVFGLTPNLFIDFLQDKAKGLTDQLQKSSASEQGKSGS